MEYNLLKVKSKSFRDETGGACVGSGLAMKLKLMGHGITMNLDSTQNYICVESSLADDLTERELQAVIYHEVGHIYHGHGTLGKILLSPLEVELEADSYAASKGYGPDLVSALHKCTNHRWSQCLDGTLKARIRALGGDYKMNTKGKIAVGIAVVGAGAAIYKMVKG